MGKKADSKRSILRCGLALAHCLTFATIANAFFTGERVAQLIEQACSECHNRETSEGGLDLTQLAWALDTNEVRQKWIQVHDRVARGEMPPGEATLDHATRNELLDGLSGPLHAADYLLVATQGRGPMRRLNRREYEENMRDLLKLPHLDIRDFLPEDSEAWHSNKSAESLDITRVQLSAYLDAADVALRQAIASGIAPREEKRYFAYATNMFPKAIDHAGRESSFFAKHSRMLPLSSGDLARIRKNNEHDPEVEVAIFRSAAWPYYGYPEQFLAEEEGEYRVRFSARAVRQVRDFRLLPAFAPQPMTFRARKPSAADVTGDVRATGGWIDVQPESQTYETSVRLRAGETIEYSLLGLPVPFPITSHGGPLYYDFPPMPEQGHAGIAFSWLEISGPIDSPSWPPPSHQVLFGELPIRASSDATSRLAIEVVSANPRQDALQLLSRFAEDAARRPLDADSVAVYYRLICNQLDAGATFAESMLTGYKAFLSSGNFLFLREPREADDHYSIAARLSHMLWNSRPDARLLRLAEQQQLRSVSTLQEETERLIRDDRFENFVINFTDYWLDLKEIRRDTPDIRLYPEYRGDDYLIDSMRHETQAFVGELLRANQPVTSLVHCDFAMLNDRLARHYELPPVLGSAMRKVSLPEGSERGGLLTQAAILKVTANGTTTSPIVRGAWLMDRILGEKPPPPPANVPAVEPDIRGATTIREILAAHAKDENCATCHRRFDGLGMALENFDILGGWRDRYRSLERGDEITGIDRAGHQYVYRVASAVDSSGQLYDGTSFEDVHELKVLLASEPRRLARNMLNRFIVYATGTPTRFSDRREIESILDACQADDYRLGDLLHQFIQSRIFVGIAKTH